MIETRLLNCCLRLAEHQNFARAAKALKISQPTLTRSIQLLEKNLGEQLFDRTSRVILPTKAGEIVLKHARTIIASSRAMEEEIKLQKGLQVGTLLIGCGPYAGSGQLAIALSQFSRLYPSIRVDIRVDDWRLFADRMQQEDFDLVLMETAELVGSPDFEITQLTRHQGFFFCRKNHPLLEKEDLKLSDLSQYDLMCPALPVRLRDLICNLFFPDRDENTPFRKLQKYTCNDLGVIKNTIRNSDSIGIGTHGILVSEIETDEFGVIPFLIPELRTGHNIVTKRALSLSPAARAFIEILIESDRSQTNSEISFIEALDLEPIDKEPLSAQQLPAQQLSAQ